MEKKEHGEPIVDPDFCREPPSGLKLVTVTREESLGKLGQGGPKKAVRFRKQL